MNVLKATADFEHWLAGQLPIIRQDLALKHQHMAEAAFPFFRATFYRWLQFWPKVCAHLAKAPAVLGVGQESFFPGNLLRQAHAALDSGA
jgi:uncharacterized protein (DUF2252 family)